MARVHDRRQRDVAEDLASLRGHVIAVLTDTTRCRVNRCRVTRHVKETLAKVFNQLAPAVAIQFQSLKDWSNGIRDPTFLAADNLTPGPIE